MLPHPGAQTGQNIAHERIAGPREAVMHPFAVALHVHQPGAPQPGQMARDFGLIEPQSAMEIADTDVAFGQQIQEAQPGGIGERLKEQVGLD